MTDIPGADAPGSSPGDSFIYRERHGIRSIQNTAPTKVVDSHGNADAVARRRFGLAHRIPDPPSQNVFTRTPSAATAFAVRGPGL
jgi:hypothetical protein